MIDAERVSDGLISFSDLLPTVMTLAGAPERVPGRSLRRRHRSDLVPARA